MGGQHRSYGRASSQPSRDKKDNFDDIDSEEDQADDGDIMHEDSQNNFEDDMEIIGAMDDIELLYDKKDKQQRAASTGKKVIKKIPKAQTAYDNTGTGDEMGAMGGRARTASHLVDRVDSDDFQRTLSREDSYKSSKSLPRGWTQEESKYLNTLWSSFTVSKVLKTVVVGRKKDERELVVLSADCTLEQACETLVNHNILSCLVQQPTTESWKAATAEWNEQAPARSAAAAVTALAAKNSLLETGQFTPGSPKTILAINHYKSHHQRQKSVDSASAAYLHPTRHAHNPEHVDHLPQVSPYLGVFSYRTLLYYTLDMFQLIRSTSQRELAHLETEEDPKRNSEPAEFSSACSPKNVPSRLTTVKKETTLNQSASSPQFESESFHFSNVLANHRSKHLEKHVAPGSVGEFLLSISEKVSGNQDQHPILIGKHDSVSAVAYNFSLGIHRVSVVTQTEQYPGIRAIASLSQMDLLFFLASVLREEKSDAKLTSMVSRSLASVGVTYKPVVVVSAEERVIDACQLLYEMKLSVLAIVEPKTFKMVDEFSTKDLKYIYRARNVGLFRRKVLQGVKEIRTRMVAETIAKSKLLGSELSPGEIDSLPFSTITLHDSIHLAVMKMLATKSSNLWVLDKRRIPVGVVTGTDLIRLLCPVMY
eukprot:CAMPEP_0184707626 /NCGR_PEP_ID=MMETSP0313-20130426/37366_1 /TAXON_ID=2792 /ORGANISM="Porphyridium aerugineum, Strain SAG 1380-2" /LENGTH=650 /DNA_ID=CAMNT_0027169205 /DNA_START=146 /DNA_END=2098 /DNA_ORIENTATION=+